MTQEERRIFLIRELLAERQEYANIQIPQNEQGEKNLLRSLFNIRLPQPIDKEFLKIQDAYLQEEIQRKGITELSDLTPVQPGIYLWQGDITTLRCDAIVNAANSQMQGCFFPLHNCIDNQIHTFSGIQLRLACDEQMKCQGHEEETGKAKITPAFNLPCNYILHTVGPVIQGKISKKEEELLRSCYRSCLTLAEQYPIRTIAFCCIATGEFHFPNHRAAEIAVHTVKKYIEQKHNGIKVIFNVFRDIDHEIYGELLGTNKKTKK